VFYSSSLLKKNNVIKNLDCKNIKSIHCDMPFSHQSCFIKKQLLIDYPYNTKLIFTSDHEFLLKIYRLGLKFTKLNSPISIIEANGVADSNKSNVWRERLTFCNKFKCKPYIYYYLFKEFFKKLMGLR